MTKVANFTLDTESRKGGRHEKSGSLSQESQSQSQSEADQYIPSLTGPALVASHMAPPAIQACMVHFASLAVLLLLAVVVVVVAVCAFWATMSLYLRSRIRSSGSLGVSRIAGERGHAGRLSGTFGEVYRCQAALGGVTRQTGGPSNLRRTLGGERTQRGLERLD